MITYDSRIQLSDRDLRRFWTKIKIGSAGQCWLWTAGTNGNYGQFRMPSCKLGAHRVAWATIHGQIPAGLEVLHTCDTPLCCNPAHLFLGTQPDNVKDMDVKGRRSNANRACGDHHGNAKLMDEQVLEILRRFNAGEPATCIAPDFGVHHSTVREIVNGERWKHFDRGQVRKGRDGMNRGERSSTAVLTEDLVRQIRHRHAAGEGLTDLGNEFDVTPQAIFSIVRRKTWKHVD